MYDNAKSHLDDIRDAYRDYNNANDDYDLQEQITQRMTEMPLEVLVRSNWQGVGETLTAGEFNILLSTGGPALRLIGDIDDNYNPENPHLEMQDWGTPWTEVWPCEASEMEEARAALLWFAGLFFFG